MATPASDPFDAFFTPERLAYYRDLHARYPLWCGDWPENLRREPEYQRYWVGSQVIDDALTEAAGGREVLALGDDEGGDLQTALVWSSEEAEAVLIEINSRSLLLHRAVAETFCRDSTKSGRSIHSFSEGLISGLEFLFDPRAFQARHEWIPVGQPYPLNGRYLRRLHRKLESARVEGSNPRKILKEIQTYWVKIGKEIGAIPQLPVGGSRCLLPDDFLGQLKDQGESLVREIRDYEPSEEDRGVLSNTVEREELSLSFVESERLAFLRRQEKLDDADGLATEVEEPLEQFPAGAPEWAVRLRFPLLARAELKFVTEIRGRASFGVAGAVLGLMAERLSISASRIANRIAGSSGQ